MGIAVDPAFDSNRRIYTCYLTAGDVRVVRWTGQRRLDDARRRAPTGHRHPARRAAGTPGAAPGSAPTACCGSRPATPPTPSNPQNPASLGGKVLRITTDGGIPAGNMGAPFLPQIYAYGFRNPQGISFRPTRRPAVPDRARPDVRRRDHGRRTPAATAGGTPGPGYNEGVPMTDLGARSPTRCAGVVVGLPDDRPVRRHVRDDATRGASSTGRWRWPCSRASSCGMHQPRRRCRHRWRAFVTGQGRLRVGGRGARRPALRAHRRQPRAASSCVATGASDARRGSRDRCQRGGRSTSR